MIEIVTHCFASRFPHYAQALRYHLSGPLYHPPITPIVFNVCYTEEDERTAAVIAEFAARSDGNYYKVVGTPLPLELLGRRHYGRDVAAAATRATLVWMADSDYYFGQGCLDALHSHYLASRVNREATDKSIVLWWPKSCKVSVDHATGDRQLASVKPGELSPIPDPSLFVNQRFPRAIGGTFILDGDYARNVGYLRGGKWSPPWKEKDVPPFASTRCDVCFRQRVKKHGVTKAVTLPELYRLRHSETAICNEAYRLESQQND